MPAPGQGALAVQCRQEAEWLAFFGGIDDRDTRAAVTAERAFLAGLGGGCRAPVGALGECGDGDGDSSSLGERKPARRLRLWGRVSALDGNCQVDARMTGSYGDAEQLGRDVAELVLSKGAQEIIEQIGESEDLLGTDRQP